MKLFGLVMCYIFLLCGAFLAFDAFIPKSKPTPFFSTLTEFAVGVIILGLAYFCIRKIRIRE
mgnify:FL=1